MSDANSNLTLTLTNTVVTPRKGLILSNRQGKSRANNKASVTILVTDDTAKAIDAYIDAIPQATIDSYSDYWKTIIPVTDQEYYNRWLFAFLSVHCTWKANVKAYQQIIQPGAMDTQESLLHSITNASVGLIAMRTKGMWNFKESFFSDPQSWRKHADETWPEFRNRAENKAYGIGLAKTAFAIELCYPLECKVTCLDTHMLQLYKQKAGTPCPSRYISLEQHWVDKCVSRNIPPFMARNVYWDKIQQQPDTRYWSYVFENSKQDKTETNVIS